MLVDGIKEKICEIQLHLDGMFFKHIFILALVPILFMGANQFVKFW